MGKENEDGQQKQEQKDPKADKDGGVDDLFHSQDNDLGFGTHGRPPGMFVIIYSQGFSFMLYLRERIQSRK